MHTNSKQPKHVPANNFSLVRVQFQKDIFMKHSYGQLFSGFSIEEMCADAMSQCV